MHIEFLHDIKDPDTGELLYHKGQRVHRMTAVCATYLDRKVAVEIKPARRGTSAWFDQRMEQSKQITVLDTQDVNPCVVGTEWGVKDASDSGFRCVTVIKRVGSETTYLSAPPPDAPDSIKRRFADLSNDTSRANAAEELQRAKNAQIEYNEKIKDIARW